MIRKTNLAAPTPDDVRMARKAAGLSQTEAAQLMSSGVSGDKAYRTWQRYEAPADSASHRPIPSDVWEFFLLLTDQHPAYRLGARRASR